MKHKWMARALSLVMVAAFLPGVVLAESYDLAAGSITVEAEEHGQYVTQENNGVKIYDREMQTTDTVIYQSDSENTSTTNTVTIESDVVQNQDGTTTPITAEVTIENVNIDVSNDGKAAISTTGEGNVTIELEGENTLKSGENHAGLEKGNVGNLTIQDQDGDGALTAEGGKNGAGIGGGNASASDITITGGTIEATGGAYGAGIGGGGEQGSGSNITITGGHVTATGADYGAGIGGGRYADGTNITIENGTVITAGGSAESERGGGAGIGGGSGGCGKNITINGGNVSATGGNASAGIGGGGCESQNLSAPGENIQISGGNVIAKGGEYGAGIGGSVMSYGKQITIDGGNVEAIGGTAAAAIGSGASAQGHSTDITVKNNVDVLAKDGVFTEWWSKKTENINTSDLGDNGLVSITRNPEENPSQLIYKSGGLVRVNTAAKYVSSTNATCTAPGTVTYRLSTGEERTLTRGGAPALGHSFTNYQSDGDATCTQDGHKSAKCDHCDAVDVVADPGSKLDHSFTNYVSDNNATCLSDGTKTALCDHGCGEKKTVQDAGSQLSHSFTKYTPDASGETETALCDNGCGTKDTRLLTAVTAQKTEEEPAEGQQTLYQVTDEKGSPVSAIQERTGKVLTITVNLDNATLRGTVRSLRALQAQGIETVVFKTNRATSTFDVAALPDGTDCALTHTGETVTFTLDGNDISNILK